MQCTMKCPLKNKSTVFSVGSNCLQLRLIGFEIMIVNWVRDKQTIFGFKVRPFLPKDTYKIIFH